MFHSPWSVLLLKLPFNIVWLHKITSNMGRFNLRGNCYMTITEWFCLLPYPWICSESYLQSFLTEISTLPQFACRNGFPVCFFNGLDSVKLKLCIFNTCKISIAWQLQMEFASLRPHLQQSLCTACGEHTPVAVSVYGLWGALICSSVWVWPVGGTSLEWFPASRISFSSSLSYSSLFSLNCISQTEALEVWGLAQGTLFLSFHFWEGSFFLIVFMTHNYECFVLCSILVHHFKFSHSLFLTKMTF